MSTKEQTFESDRFVTQPRQITAVRVVSWAALGVLLFFAHTACIPVALAMLIALVLSGPVELLHKRGFPRSLGAILILVLVLGSMVGVVALLWTPTQEWFAKAPQTLMTIKQKMGPVARFMNELETLRKNAANMGSTSRAAPAPAAEPAESAPALIFDETGPLLAGGLTVLIVSLFLLTGGPPMLARMTAAFVDNLKASHVLQIIEQVREEVGRFYVTTTLINVGLGLATSGAMMAWGMPTPLLWGAIAAVLNYIPYAGAVTTLIVVTLVAVVSFNTLGHVLGVAGTYVLIATIEGQLVQPLLVGRRLQVNPLLIFLALWCGGLFWGIAGVILATPSLVALKVIAEHAESGKAMMEFLGPNDQTPDRDKRLQQFARKLE
jgi:predicted PurR-regulated permease PerM